SARGHASQPDPRCTTGHRAAGRGPSSAPPPRIASIQMKTRMRRHISSASPSFPFLRSSQPGSSGQAPRRDDEPPNFRKGRSPCSAQKAEFSPQGESPSGLSQAIGREDSAPTQRLREEVKVWAAYINGIEALCSKVT